jgi:hypothetical protein
VEGEPLRRAAADAGQARELDDQILDRGRQHLHARQSEAAGHAARDASEPALLQRA